MSLGIFHRLTQAVKRMMAKAGFPNVVVYLDDFLCVEGSKDRCILAQKTLISLLRKLCFAIAWDKVEGPLQCLVFLGVEIDSVAGELRLPEKKLREFGLLVDECLGKRRITLKKLQALAGKLNWAASVVRGGRTYLRRILDVMKPMKGARHKRLITNSMHADLEWRKAFLAVFNGKRVILQSKGEVVAFVDASSKAGGICCGYDWQYVEWKQDVPHIADCHINVKETAAVVMAARKWGPSWSGYNVKIFTDNTSTLHAVNKGSSTNSDMMCFIRELFWLGCKYNFDLVCVYVPGVDNYVADCVSRLYEDGRLFQMETIFGYITPIFKLIWPFLFLKHMSYVTFMSLIPQILRWLNSETYFGRGS